MQASISASVLRLVLDPEAPAHLQDRANCKFAEKHAAFRETGKKEIERRVTGQRQQHESVPPSICFGFRATSAAPHEVVSFERVYTEVLFSA